MTRGNEMGEVKIYRGTVDKGLESEKEILVHEVRSNFYRSVGQTVEVFTNISLTDLIELELHEAGTGVWIEGVSAEEIRWIVSWAFIDPSSTSKDDLIRKQSINLRLYQALAQLSPEESPSLGEVPEEGAGGEKTHIGNCDCRLGVHEDFCTCKPTPPTVTIDLALFEQEIADMRSDARIYRNRGGSLDIQMSEELEHFATAFETLVPHPLAEPKEYGTRLEASVMYEGKEMNRDTFLRFSKTGDLGKWISTSGYVYNFSDLINPRRVGGAE